MKSRGQVIFDIDEERFKYLYRYENKIKKILNIDDLNARLNETKKLNFYSNIRVVSLCLACLIIISLISI